MPMPMTGSWAATRGRWRCPSPISPDPRSTAGSSTVGCGPGALTAELARRASPGQVTAVDPSEEFVGALRGRQPGVQVIRAPAEELPFEGGCFDATLAQLVVHVMDDPVAGLREMARVTGSAASSPHACGTSPTAVRSVRSGMPPKRSILRSRLALSPPAAGPATWPTCFARLESAKSSTAPSRWTSSTPRSRTGGSRCTLDVAPSGAHVAGLEPDRRTALRELCRERLPEPPFVVSAKAWVARGAA